MPMSSWHTRLGLLLVSSCLGCAGLMSLTASTHDPAPVASATDSLDPLVLYLATKPTPRSVVDDPGIVWQVSPDGDVTVLAEDSDSLRQSIFDRQFGIAGLGDLATHRSDGALSFALGGYGLTGGSGLSDLLSEDNFLPFYAALAATAFGAD
jgi:hypothetical protein